MRVKRRKRIRFVVVVVAAVFLEFAIKASGRRRYKKMDNEECHSFQFVSAESERGKPPRERVTGCSANRKQLCQDGDCIQTWSKKGRFGLSANSGGEPTEWRTTLQVVSVLLQYLGHSTTIKVRQNGNRDLIHPARSLDSFT